MPFNKTFAPLFSTASVQETSRFDRKLLSGVYSMHHYQCHLETSPLQHMISRYVGTFPRASFYINILMSKRKHSMHLQTRCALQESLYIWDVFT